MRKKALITISILTIMGCVILVYFFFTRCECKFIPISLNAFNLPLIEAEVEGKIYPLIIDLGSIAQTTFDSEILQKMKKTPNGITQSRDFKGNCYESPSYFIPEIKIGDVVFVEVIAEEKNNVFDSNTLICEPFENTPAKKKGSIGWSLLKRKNILLDFPHSRLAFIDNEKRMGYPIEEMLKVPFVMTSLGITLNIVTDIGEKKFLIDTGTSLTSLRSSPCAAEKCQKDSRGLHYFTTSQFIIEGKNFGKVDLCVLDITPQMNEIDGFLGMNFFNHHVVYIDFRKKILYIGKTVFEIRVK